MGHAVFLVGNWCCGSPPGWSRNCSRIQSILLVSSVLINRHTMQQSLCFLCPNFSIIEWIAEPRSLYFFFFSSVNCLRETLYQNTVKRRLSIWLFSSRLELLQFQNRDRNGISPFSMTVFLFRCHWSRLIAVLMLRMWRMLCLASLWTDGIPSSQLAVYRFPRFG